MVEFMKFREYSGGRIIAGSVRAPWFG